MSDASSVSSANAPAPPEEDNPIDDCLAKCGFTLVDQQVAIHNDGFATFEDFLVLKEKDLDSMAKSFAKRTQANGRIIFETARTKKLKGLLNWVQDCLRCKDTPVADEFNLQKGIVAQQR